MPVVQRGKESWLASQGLPEDEGPAEDFGVSEDESITSIFQCWLGQPLSTLLNSSGPVVAIARRRVTR